LHKEEWMPLHRNRPSLTGIDVFLYIYLHGNLWYAQKLNFFLAQKGIGSKCIFVHAEKKEIFCSHEIRQFLSEESVLSHYKKFWPEKEVSLF
jgi:hypothetical protein